MRGHMSEGRLTTVIDKMAREPDTTGVRYELRDGLMLNEGDAVTAFR